MPPRLPPHRRLRPDAAPFETTSAAAEHERGAGTTLDSGSRISNGGSQGRHNDHGPESLAEQNTPDPIAEQMPFEMDDNFAESSNRGTRNANDQAPANINEAINVRADRRSLQPYVESASESPRSTSRHSRAPSASVSPERTPASPSAVPPAEQATVESATLAETAGPSPTSEGGGGAARSGAANSDTEEEKLAQLREMLTKVLSEGKE